MAKLGWRVSERDPGARDFVLEPESGRDVTGAVWLPASHHPDSATVLFGHGASGDRYQPPIPYLARRFVEAGVAAVALDGPVHGLRQVGPGGRAAFAQEMQRPTFLDDMVADWDRALCALRAEAGVARGRVAYFGLSMGSIFGVPLLAARDDLCAAGIGLVGTTGATRHIGSRLGDDASKIRIPILFIMQLEDELFPREGCLELFDRLASDEKRIHANPGRHPQVPPEEIDFAYDFLQRHLRGGGSRGRGEDVAS